MRVLVLRLAARAAAAANRRVFRRQPPRFPVANRRVFRRRSCPSPQRHGFFLHVLARTCSSAEFSSHVHALSILFLFGDAPVWDFIRRAQTNGLALTPCVHPSLVFDPEKKGLKHITCDSFCTWLIWHFIQIHHRYAPVYSKSLNQRACAHAVCTPKSIIVMHQCIRRA